MLALYALFPEAVLALVSDHLVRDTSSIMKAFQQSISSPFSTWVNVSGWRMLWLIPWYLGIGFLLRGVHLMLKKRYRYIWMAVLLILITLRIFPNMLLAGESDKASKSVGSVRDGSLVNGKRIRFSGPNFTTYSFFGYLAGRTFVHDKVRKTVIETYQKCEKALPDIEFVLMETGHRNGGKFSPHRTHQNGLSVDFMTPLLKGGKPYNAHHVFTGFGYGYVFDNQGKVDDLEIDYETTAKHLLLLHETAQANGLRIKKVIFDPVLQPYLFKTPSGKKLKGKFYFTRGRVTFRHDDHYHVDFELK
jgi:penicillin-insensitive murein endopeptidase